MNFSTIYSNLVSKRHLAKLHKALKGVNNRAGYAESLSNEQISVEFQSLRSVPLEQRIEVGFALVREAAFRTLGLKPFDVQILAGLALLNRTVAEMKTGEGKTLTVAAPAALMALDGKGVHVVTANPYLAKRDAETLRPLYEFLGLSVSCIEPGAPIEAKQAAYAADVSYSVNFELGFDYLRDSLATSLESRVQRKRAYVIVDELDSILIDDARTPLIISGHGPDMSEQVKLAWRAVKDLRPGTDFHAVEKEHSANLTDTGWHEVESFLVKEGTLQSPAELYRAGGLALAKRIEAAVKVRTLYRRDRDYVVAGGEIVLVDRGTGRAMAGRRLEDALHEMLEAKEGLKIQQAAVTQATISYQNYFGQYPHLCGLTGTAFTEADELAEIYSLEVVQVPTNAPPKKRYYKDRLFSTQAEKLAFAAELIQSKIAKGQPVLAGCSSIREAEALSAVLKANQISHELLTAKHVEREAEIISRAGTPGAVTVATHMAGRGTDILLGGPKPGADASDEIRAAYVEKQLAVKAAGGLFVLALERNGIRRVDEQLAGRCGRQGDPGEVLFIVSLEDELFKIYAGASGLKALAGDIGALSEGVVQKVIRRAQIQFERQGFEARKELLKYDEVINQQREAFFELRNECSDVQLSRERVTQFMVSAVSRWFLEKTEGLVEESWPLAELKQEALDRFNLKLPIVRWVAQEDRTREEIAEKLAQEVVSLIDASEELYPADVLRASLDAYWPDHLASLAELQKSSGLAAATGKNPVHVYKEAAFEAFKGFLSTVEDTVAEHLLRGAGVHPASAKIAVATPDELARAAVFRESEKRWIGRNERCPCGSGIRFKSCHGKLS